MFVSECVQRRKKIQIFDSIVIHSECGGIEYQSLLETGELSFTEDSVEYEDMI